MNKRIFEKKKCAYLRGSICMRLWSLKKVKKINTYAKNGAKMYQKKSSITN